MKSAVIATLAAVLLAACSAPPKPAPSYVSPSASTAPAEDETSAFVSDADNQQAKRAIEQAETAYGSLQQTTAAFLARSAADCNSPAMESAIRSLEPVDAEAQRYMRLAGTASELSDREAAMDVLDELNKVVLDGLMDISKAYRTKGCLPRARHLMTEARRIYAGPAYQGWASAMDSELQSIRAAEAVSPPTKKRR
jgi:hypothetical protein